VFNKWEIAGEDRYEECLDRVGDLEVDVAKIKSAKGWVGMDLVFGVDGGLAKELTEAEADGTRNGVQNGHSHDHNHSHSHDHQSEVEVLSIDLKGAKGAAVSWDKLVAFLKSAPKDEAYRIKAIMTLSSTPLNSDPDVPKPASHPHGRYILNWAFGRWAFTPVAETLAEHKSSDCATLRMTMILGRYESGKWKKKLETGGLVALEGGLTGELSVKRIL
jgi:hypothetical protein